MKFFKNNSNVKNIIVIFSFALFLSLSFANTSEASVTYDGAKIVISNSAESITTINQALNNNSLLEQTAPKEWLLKVPLQVESAGSLTIDGSNASWLKLQSLNDDNIVYIKNLGSLTINNTKISSWNIINNTEALSTDRKRSYIWSTGANTIMNIYNSNFSNLGYNSANSFGVSYTYVNKSSIIDNSTFSNNYVGIYAKYTKNLKVKNCHIYDSVSHGIYLDAGSNNNIVEQNTIERHKTKYTYGIIVYAAYNNSIINNTLSDNYYSIYLSAGASGITSDNNIISYNNITGSSAAASFIGIGIVDGKSNNNTVSNNIISVLDIGMNIGSNTNISYNKLSDFNLNTDNWNLGIYAAGSNITINNNDITSYGSTGIFIFPGSNISIHDNYIDALPISQKTSVVSTDSGEINSAISILQQYKGGQVVLKKSSSGISIYKNILGENNQAYLYMQGAQNVSASDIPEYWHSSFELPDTGVGKVEIYANPIFNTLLQRDSRKLFTFAVESGLVEYHYLATDSILGGGTEPQVAFKLSKSLISFANAIDAPRIIKSYNPKCILFNQDNILTNTIYSDGVCKVTLPKDPSSVPPYMIARPALENFLANNAAWYSSINFYAVPSVGSLDVSVQNWKTTDDYYRKWMEYSSNPFISVSHTIGDLPPSAPIDISKNGVLWKTLVSDSLGVVEFIYNEGFSTVQFELIKKSPSISPADLNQDGIVNSVDFGILMSYWNSVSRPKADLNQDGIVNSVDFGIMMSKWGG